MPTSFRRPLQVIRRVPGIWVEGMYQPAPEPEPETILATVQPATASDYERLEARPSGRRLNGLHRVYTDAALTPAGETDETGDVVLIRGERHLVIGEHVRDQLGSRVSHRRYLAARVAEGQGARV